MRVFLIEDDELLGDGLTVGLEQAGWVVDWVTDGDAAQAALATTVFDLLVLDLGLPRRPGIEILRWLRARGNKMPVLILTAEDSVRARVTTLDCGADDYISKPFDLDELCARLRALHRRAVGCVSPTLRHGDIELDPGSRSVTLEGKPVALSPKELGILQILVENSGKIVPRDRLMMSSYGWHDDVGSNVLEVHIHHLRRKLGLDSLKAVRGLGYRLD